MHPNPESPCVICLEETDSTNRYLQQLADAVPVANESVVMAAVQTAGRGQAGNVWESEAGKNLTCSFLLYPPRLEAAQAFVLAELAALSVKHVLDKYTEGVTLKWPNDVYHLDRKICGILIENRLLGDRITRSIVGIGLNLNQTLFRSHAPNPVSLTQITGQVYDPPALLAQLRRAVRQYLRQYEAEGAENMHRQYADALYRRDGFHPYEDAAGRFDARIQCVEPSGHLILRRPDGTLSRYAFKEVKFIGSKIQ
ncbi:MAG: biotin--[acetyl-CoA-carboxylase] ligase [Tannerella sp.]|nr:biotin--[acetyl-CoA-carboxylase] ligase [Tannerella sp.]